MFRQKKHATSGIGHTTPHVSGNSIISTKLTQVVINILVMFL